MTTQNKAVTCYLPKDIEDFITGYCNEYGITRKDKEGSIYPSLGTGIIELLKQLAYNPELVGRPLPDTVPSTISEAAIEKKIDDILGGKTIRKEEDSRLTDLRLTDLESRLQKVEENLDLVFEAAETIEEREEPDKISQVMEAFKGVTKILSEHNSRLIAVESSHQEIIDRIQAVEIAIDCQHYGDEVKELRGQVDELRNLVYQLTSPVKRR
ncbi:Ribbon-helix-helix protein CopG domain-containing protein [Microcystis aeruginosa]